MTEMMNWQKMLQQSYRSCEQMTDLFAFSEEEVQSLKEIEERYPVCVNPYYFGLIDLEDKEDPIRKMSIPNGVEFSPGGEEDTSGEAENTVIPGMQHKYRQTALILSTNQCAMYCRHCFRKRLVGSSEAEIASQKDAMVKYVKEHTEITNLLISGGDAFLCSNQLLEEYIQAFCEIDHIDYIRLGTRIPVVLPQRIIEDLELQQILKKYASKKTLFIITQFNHPRELTGEARKGIRILRECGCIVRNQAVLLRGVNDQAKILGDLMNGLIRMGVIPYYIFQCRPVIGVKNQFQVPIEEGIQIIDQAKHLMSGQSKGLRYCLSHPDGKIEIIGKDDSDRVIFKFHQAKRDEDCGRIFAQKMSKNQSWITDIK